MRRGGACMLAAGCLLVAGCESLRMNATEKMMWATHPVGTLAGDATGFVVLCEDGQSENGATPVLITSVHVLETLGKGPLVMAFRQPGEKGEEPEVSLLAYLPGSMEDRKNFYVRHPLHDVAAIRLRFPPEIANQVPMTSILSRRKLAANPARVRAGDEVLFLGYPETFPGTEGAMPILRSGRVASYTGTGAASGNRFLINADVYPGDSGGPVFAVRHGRVQLAGVITRKVSATKQAFSHLAVAVDAEVVRETLQLLMDSEKG
jgi:hypothetical protein